MFGLEKKSEKKSSEFDLEKEMQDPVKYRALKTRVEGQLQKVKQALAAGEESETFHTLKKVAKAYEAIILVSAMIYYGSEEGDK